MECHYCRSTPDALHICSNCHFATYCNKDECQAQDYIDEHKDFCETVGQDIWSTENVRDVLLPLIQSPFLRNQVEQAIKTKKSNFEMDLQLKTNIANDLLINGKIFQAYMKAALRTKLGRGRVADKLVGKGKRFKYLSQYTESQKEEIREIVESDPDKFDKEGWVRDALEGTSRHGATE